MERTDYCNIEVSMDRQGRFYMMPNAHVHPVYEIYYLVSGSRKFFIKSDIYNISKGDLVFIDKNAMHRTTYSSDKLNERAYVLFDDKHIKRFIEEYGSEELEQCLKQRVFSIPIQRREYVEGLISKLYTERRHGDEFSQGLMENCLYELMVFLVRYKRSFFDAREDISSLSAEALSPGDENIQRAARYIVENYRRDISLTDAAEYVSMSSTYFSKKFKEVTGFGFKEYLLNLRIKKASELLLETRLSVTEIAYESGFNDSNYFGDVFKKSKGISPLGYRKNKEQI